VVLEAELLEPLRDVTGDRGARNLLRRVGALGVPCDDLGGGEDVDTKDELGKLRSAP
jgi:CTP:molybdopterin cytidylyltransferase MocA